MTRDEFKACAKAMAAKHNWTLDIVEDEGAIEAWFSEPHPEDKPGRPYGLDIAQAYMRAGEDPVGLDV